MSWTKCLSYRIEALTVRQESDSLKRLPLRHVTKCQKALQWMNVFWNPYKLLPLCFPKFDSLGVWNYKVVYVWMFAAYSDLPWGHRKGRENLTSSWLENPYRLHRRLVQRCFVDSFLTQLQILGCCRTNSVCLLNSSGILLANPHIVN